MAACIFCQIVAAPARAHVVAQTDAHLAFLDKRPVFPGHVLVIPRAHVETLADVAPDALAPLFTLAQRIMRALGTALSAEGTFVAVNNKISQSVPHLHVHVVPRRAKDGLRGFFWPRHAYASEDEAAAVAARIRAELT